ncbi:MAG: hypothetical protein ACREBF_04075 [Candidatus Micrarchaeales archaeon]
MAKIKTSRAPDCSYLTFKILETPMDINALSQQYKNAVRDLVKSKSAETPTFVWEGKSYKYNDNIVQLNNLGRAQLEAIRQSPKLLARLEKEAGKIIKESEIEVKKLREKIFSHFAY